MLGAIVGDIIPPGYRYDETCAGSVPQSIIAFLESTTFEDPIRNAVSLGGDADTMACIAGGIAEAFYGGVPAEISEKALEFLEPPLANIVKEFASRFQQGIE